MWRYIFEVDQRVCACVFLFVIEEREVENGELEKERKEEHEKKINFFEQKIWSKIFRGSKYFVSRVHFAKSNQKKIANRNFKKKKKIFLKKLFSKFLNRSNFFFR